MNKHDALKIAMEGLWSNPLYHASLGSKELFHSNVLAWLCETYPTQMREVFAEQLIPDACAAAKAPLREDRKLDLVLFFNGAKPLVIENKVKSLPDPRQLGEYDAVVEKHHHGASRVLLSLLEPDFRSSWTSLSYKEIIPRIEAVGKHLPDRFHSDMIGAWCGLLLGLQKVADAAAIGDADEDYFLLSAFEELQRHRLHGLVYRLRAQQAKNHIVRQLQERGSAWAVFGGTQSDFADAQIVGPTLLASTHFTNETPILDFYCRLPGIPCVFGVQIQSDQYRLFGKAATAKDSRGDGAPEENKRQRWARKKSDWGMSICDHLPTLFDFSLFDAFIAKRTGAREPRKVYPSPAGFNGFEPDFVYRAKRLVSWLTKGEKKGKKQALPSEMSLSDLTDLVVLQLDSFAAAKTNFP